MLVLLAPSNHSWYRSYLLSTAHHGMLFMHARARRRLGCPHQLWVFVMGAVAQVKHLHHGWAQRRKLLCPTLGIIQWVKATLQGMLKHDQGLHDQRKGSNDPCSESLQTPYPAREAQQVQPAALGGL